MRVLVIGSCSKRKLHSSPIQPRCRDIDEHHHINYWTQKHLNLCSTAREMYIGPQHIELVKGVDLLRTIHNVEIRFAIISAGFGLLQELDLVPPYDCSFLDMKIAEVRKRSEDLRLQLSFSRLANKGFDLVYLALGQRYLEALGGDLLSTMRKPTIVFHGESTDSLIRMPCSTEIVKALSRNGHKIHGVVGFKGDLLRILAEYALEQPQPSAELQQWINPSHLPKLLLQLSAT